MKHISIVVFAGLFGSSLSSGALAAACSLTGYVVSPNLMTYSVPGLGLAAFDGVPDGCDLVMPVQTGGDDVVSLFSASYSGELTDSTGARLIVTHNGVSDVTDLVGATGGSFGELATGSVFARGNKLNSTFSIAVTNAVGADEFDLESADYVLQSKANLFDLSSARTGVVTHLSGTFELLNGAGQPVDSPDGVSSLGGIGSITLGVSGQTHLNGVFILKGGAAYVDQSTAGARTSGLLFSGAARYLVPVGTEPLRPFVEAGLNAAPGLNATFGLNFTTLTSSVFATGSTTASYFGGYLKGGVVVDPTEIDKVVLAASVSSDVLSTGPLSETGTGTFTVNQAAQSGLFSTARAGADWTHQFTPALSSTLTTAVGRNFALDTVSSTVPGAGAFTTSGASETFVEYGARATYSLSEATSLGAFVFGTNGEISGNHLQVGAIARVSF